MGSDGAVGAYDPEVKARRNAAIVRALTDALGARDAAAVEALLADDVVYHFPGRNPMSGTFRGDRISEVFVMIDDQQAFDDFLNT